jgi:RHS repeat-associated protein
MNQNGDGEPLAYDEFGVPEVTVGSIQQPFGFTGYQMDDVSGLQYAQARYYSPVLGRFTAEDRVRDGRNWYVYCYNNPLIFVDLNGLIPCPIDAALMADYVYNRDGEMKKNHNINGWVLVEIQTNTNTWYERNLTGNGMLIGVFEKQHDDGTVEYALVNRGTVNVKNGIDNLNQIFASSADTRDSVNFAREFVANANGNEVTMIGHSKGGAEARMNAFATNTNAILFNPATGSWSTAFMNGRPFNDIRNHTGITTYIVEGEWLSNIQGFYTEHIGELIMLKPHDETLGAGKRHGIAAVIEALRLNYGDACQ